MLTHDDIQVLMEALDALEKRNLLEAINAGIIGIGMADDKVSARIRLENELKALKEKDTNLAETIILIKAKLIHMKNKSIADEAKDFLIKGE